MMLHVYKPALIKPITGEDSSGRSKNVAVRLKFVKLYSKKVVIKIVYYESEMMPDVALTKPFAATRLRELRNLVSLV